MMFVICIQMNQFASSGNRSDAEQLYDYLFTGYNTHILPSYKTVLNVSLGMYLFSINDFNEVSGIFSAVGGVYFLWPDSRLEWKPEDFGNLTTLVVPSTKVWYPELYLINPAENLTPLGDGTFVTRLQCNGYLLRFMGSMIKTTCSVDTTYYPYDEQTCQIKVSAWGYDPKTEVRLQNLSTTLDLFYYQENAQWKLTKTEMKPYKIEGFTSGTIDGIVVGVISMQRQPEYLVLNILVPIFLLCFLNPFVFLLPPESGERVSYTVTIFLSIAVFMTIFSETMPKSSHPMSMLSYFLTILMAYSTFICLITILIMRMYFKHDDEPIPQSLLWFLYVLKWQCLRCRSANKVAPLEKSRNFNMMGGSYNTKTWKHAVAEIDKICFWYSITFIFLLITVVLLSFSI